MNKKQKILAILNLILVLFLIGTPSLAKAGLADWIGDTLKWIGAGALGGILYFIGLFVAGLAALAVMIAGWLVNFAVGINFDLLNSPLVGMGWKISRDLANLGFVLFIIIIAIATILRYQEYAAKSTLAKLIAVALLVNFSLMGAGLFVDFSNMLTKFFTDNISGGSLSAIGTALVAPFNIQQYLKTDTETAMEKAGEKSALTPGGLLSHASSLLLIAIMTILVAFCLFALGVMFLIRYISLSILLVLVPLACLFWIIPATKNLWGKWWDNFMRWILFAPAASFFLWLSVYFMNNYNDIIKGNLSRIAQGEGAAKIGDITLGEGMFGNIAVLVIMGGFVLGGLIVANKLGIEGAKAAYGAAEGGLKGFGKWAERKGVRTAGWAAHPSDRMLDWATNPKAGKTKQFVGRTMYKIQSGLSKVPVVKGLGKAYRGKGEHKNLFASVVGGMKSGSGLFKGKQAKDWECQTPGCGNVIRATSKPKSACTSCGKIDWKGME